LSARSPKARQGTFYLKEASNKPSTRLQGIKIKVNALYSYPYLNQQNPLFLPIIASTLFTTKLEIRAK
jgi:hypothetical protein